MNNINTIFFDAGGVLFDTEKHREERIKNILRAKGFNNFDIERGLNKGEEFSIKLMKAGHWMSTWADEEGYWDNYYDTILRELKNDNTYSLKKQLFHHTHYAIHCKLYDEVRGLLENLQGHYKLGVISNALPSMDWVFDLLDIRRYFDSITISAFVGDSKPNKNIYEVALKSINSAAKECIFIDDKLKNVQAAQELGFTGIHLDRSTNNLNIIESILNINSIQEQACI